MSEVVCQRRRPWDPFGVARFDIAELLSGQRMVKLTTPITAGWQTPPSREDCQVGPHGRGERSTSVSCDDHVTISSRRTAATFTSW